MPPIDDDNLPEQLQHDLRRLLPSLPADLVNREQAMLDQAHLALTSQRGRRTGWRWLAAGSAVAAMLLIAITAHRSGDYPVATPSTLIASAHRITIIDAFAAARRPDARQADIDHLAMAAVALDSPEVQ